VSCCPVRILTRSAILRYHAIKMEEINDTIGHLWSKTYQGTGESSIRTH
jgi:DNA repair protein RAD50